MYTAVTPFRGQGAYVLWVVGIVVVCFTLVQSARAGGRPKMRFPQLTGPQISTVAAWLIIAILVLFAATRIK